jgi:hypothetical protein
MLRPGSLEIVRELLGQETPTHEIGAVLRFSRAIKPVGDR